MKKIKVAKVDFNPNLLPKTRKQQFLDILKHNYPLFLLLGLILFLFAIPMLCTLAFRDASLISIYSTEGLSEEEQYSRLFSTYTIHSVIFAFSLVVFGVGISGVIKIIKQLIFGEPVFFKEDFKSGFKENFKSILIISLLIGVFSIVGNVLSMLVKSNVVGAIILGINYCLIYPLCFVSIFITSYYKNSYFMNLKTAFYFYIKYFPFVILFYLGFFILILCKLITLNVFFVAYIVIAIYLFFAYPILILGTNLYLINLFDEKFNKTQFPEFYKKGLFLNDDFK